MSTEGSDKYKLHAEVLRQTKQNIKTMFDECKQPDRHFYCPVILVKGETPIIHIGDVSYKDEGELNTKLARTFDERTATGLTRLLITRHVSTETKVVMLCIMEQDKRVQYAGWIRLNDDYEPCAW